jgi:hypothetical protein
MQITIEQNVATKIARLAKFEHKNLEDFLQETLKEIASGNYKKLTIEEKERRAVEAYRKNPIQPDEFFIEEEQLIEVWKDL